jgi:3-hydroxyacyl-CoA dehydrogenase
MRWGFNWEMGPFEIWDALGIEPTAERIRREGGAVPPVVEQLLASGSKSFYRSEFGRRYLFDLASKQYLPIDERPGILILKQLKEKPGAVIQRNAGASLVDLGGGVACVEFHSKMNAIGADIIQMLHAGLKKLREDFRGLVIGNQAASFSVGANIMLLLVAALEGDWEEIDLAVRTFQGVNMAIKYAPRPVVAAPFGMSLGGGCETPLHAARIHAAAECYIGLVETGVGLIPAGGGCKEMLVRSNERAPSGEALDLEHALKQVFEQIAMAKVATSAEEAKAFGYLRPADRISMNSDRLIADAKQTAIELDEAGWRPPAPAEIKVLGESAAALMKLAVHIMKRAGYATEHDAVVGAKLAHVLAGGPLSAPQTVSEQYILDLEREAFLSLCGERKTLERIQYTLKAGKPLRN